MKHLYNCLLFLITGSMGLSAQPFTVSIDNLPNPAPYEYCPPATTSATIQMLITGTVLPGPYTVVLATSNGPNQTIVVPDNGSNVFSFNLSPTQNVQYTVLSVRSGNNTLAILVPPLIFSVTPCPPPVQLSAPPSACTGTPFTLNATPGYANYQWSTGANGNSNSVVVTPSATGTTTYTVTVTTAGGLVSTAQASVVVSSSSLNPVICCNTAICNGSPVTLNVNNGPYGAYNWSNGGTGSTISVNTPATYTVTVTQLNGGCTATATLAVGSGSSPVVSINGPSFVCNANNVLLSVSPSFEASYVWSTGFTTGFSEYDLNNPNGTYSVTVTSPNGCTGTASITIPQGAPPVGSIVGMGPPPQNAFCANDPQFLSFQPAAATYLWDNGATTQSIPYLGCNPPFNTTFHAVTVTDQFGCSATYTGSTVPNISNFHGFQSATVCEGDYVRPQIFLVNSSFGVGEPIEVVLSDGVNTYINTFPPPNGSLVLFEPIYLPVGTHVLSFVSVRRILSGCVHYIQECNQFSHLNFTVVVEANGLPPLSITGGSAVCNGQPVSLTASPGFTQYSWSNGGTGQGISVNMPGTYTVIASNGGACTSSAFITVASIPFTPPVIVGPPSVCPGLTATLSINNATYSSYEWYSGGNGASVITTTPGSYTATVTSAAGCTGTASFTLGNLPVPNASISNVPNICPGQTVTLTANGGTAYVWNTGQTTDNITVTAGGIFTVTATASNGCTATATSSILQRPLPTVQFALPQPDICGGDCVTVQVTFTGTAPFSLTYSVASAAAITAIFSGTTGTIQVCVPVGTALGPLQIQATSLTDAWCNCN
jgi:hypothetical protein